MPHILSITQSQAPLTVVEAAYRWFCHTDQFVENATNQEEFAISLSAPLQRVLFPTLVTAPSGEWFEFRCLVAQWQSEKGATSSITEMAMRPAYQSIIAMGAKAIPLIIQQLRSEGDEPDMWFWALRVLTGVDPVRDEERGDVVRMARAWLQWAECEGYAW